MFIIDLFDYIFSYVENLLDLLSDSAISDFLFDGQVTLFQVIITFFVGAVLIKFLLSPVRLQLSNSSAPVKELSTAERYEDNRNASMVRSIYNSYNGGYNGNL